MPNPSPLSLDDFPVTVELPVQWGDQDAFGHVNNTVYFRWFETSRIAYLEKLGMADKHSPGDLGPILAAINCNYRLQITWPDQVTIGARVTRIGKTSMTIEHVVWSAAQQAVAADGQSVVVAFNYLTGKTQAVPEEMRRKIEELEGQKPD